MIADGTVNVRGDDVRVLLDRVVYNASPDNWTPDGGLEALDADLLETVARCLRALEADHADPPGEGA